MSKSKNASTPSPDPQAVEQWASEVISEPLKPYVGEVIWYWARTIVNNHTAVCPIAGIVTFVREGDAVNVCLFERNGTNFIDGVPYSDKPTRAHWSRPVPDWTDEMGITVAPKPPSNRPRPQTMTMYQRIEMIHKAKLAAEAGAEPKKEQVEV